MIFRHATPMLPRHAPPRVPCRRAGIPVQDPSILHADRQEGSHSMEVSLFMKFYTYSYYTLTSVGPGALGPSPPGKWGPHPRARLPQVGPQRGPRYARPAPPSLGLHAHHAHGAHPWSCLVRFPFLPVAAAAANSACSSSDVRCPPPPRPCPLHMHACVMHIDRRASCGKE